jgi:hypothetical protein
MSATIPIWVEANRPKPKPRPVTTFSFERLEAATFAFQPAVIVAPSITDSQREPAVVVPSMFNRRNAIGSMFAANASSSINCSLQKYDCGAFGARNALIFSEPSYSGCVFANTLRAPSRGEPALACA